MKLTLPPLFSLHVMKISFICSLNSSQSGMTSLLRRIRLISATLLEIDLKWHTRHTWKVAEGRHFVFFTWANLTSHKPNVGSGGFGGNDANSFTIGLERSLPPPPPPATPCTPLPPSNPMYAFAPTPPPPPGEGLIGCSSRTNKPEANEVTLWIHRHLAVVLQLVLLIQSSTWTKLENSE